MVREVEETDQPIDTSQTLKAFLERTQQPYKQLPRQTATWFIL